MAKTAEVKTNICFCLYCRKQFDAKRKFELLCPICRNELKYG